MGIDKNKEKEYNIKVPVFLTDEKETSEEKDLFGNTMSSQMISIVKEQIKSYNNNRNQHVTSDKRSKTSVTGVNKIEFTDCKIHGTECLLLQVTAYRTKLYDGYYQGSEDESIIVFKENDKLCSDTHFILLYPKFSGIKSPYKVFWYILVYEDPSKNNEEVTRVAKLIMKDIFKYPIRNIKEPSLLETLKKYELINQIEISLSSITEDDTEVDVYLQNYKYTCKFKKEKKMLFENVPADIAEKVFNDDNFIQEAYSKKQVKFLLANKQVLTMTKEYRENLKRTLEDSFNYSFPVTQEEIKNDSIFKKDFIVEKLGDVLQNFLSINDK